jgi:nicotinamidase-related amidase
METLILIDIQNDYFVGGANPLVGSSRACLQAKHVLQHFRNKNQPVIHVKHISVRKGSTFFLKSTTGAEIHEKVTPAPGEQIFIKHYPNAFLETDLEGYLERIKATELVICGMMTHMCVDSSVRAANDLGYDITLIGDACATKDLKWGNKIIPAETVHSSYLAGLSNTFAKVIQARKFLTK